ncbi:hypothetical protein ACQKP8_23520 [Photobacterium alginatilyticum]|uniref:hypothetical protein n=1 Tax=Photobacterium alginatilyticum TaxID=1775171 RepID=UPI004068DC08
MKAIWLPMLFTLLAPQALAVQLSDLYGESPNKAIGYYIWIFEEYHEKGTEAQIACLDKMELRGFIELNLNFISDLPEDDEDPLRKHYDKIDPVKLSDDLLKKHCNTH